jgi:two-component system, OmpR family, heavy metal sensor histidine kinase CusS
VSAGARGGSLVGRLVLLFVVGSGFIMSGAGYALYHALRMRLEANDLQEIRGKSAVIDQTLREVVGADTLAAALDRIRDLPAGHPRLAVGVRYSDRWIFPLERELVAAMSGAPERVQWGYPRIDAGQRTWLLHRANHAWTGPEGGSVEVVLAVETTDTRELLREHALMAVVVAALGTLASALLAWFVSRRGLAPLGQLAARAGEVTARRLGERLDLEDAPLELHGLADSINRMLERLEESFRALEQFSADIAHELRTPLNNLLLQTQVTLSRPRTASEYQDALHSNLEELERLQHMVSDMLFLARADRGMIELRVEPIDLRPEIEGIAEYFEAAAAEKSQRIVVHGEGRIDADRLMVRRAVNNLLSNAVRYSPPGATIDVAIANDDSGSAITVSNPGDTIPAEELRRLFARFSRRDVSRGREVEGAGLGLAIVESIMKLLGGRVQASSERDTVSFALRFPYRNLSNP